MPEERTCSICGVTREDVADVAYYGDNLRKGAALNAVQIAEALVASGALAA